MSWTRSTSTPKLAAIAENAGKYGVDPEGPQRDDRPEHQRVAEGRARVGGLVAAIVVVIQGRFERAIEASSRAASWRSWLIPWLSKIRRLGNSRGAANPTSGGAGRGGIRGDTLPCPWRLCPDQFGPVPDREPGSPWAAFPPALFRL